MRIALVSRVMATGTYLGVVERAGHGFGVFFPDVPGCVTAGTSLFEAMENGAGVLAEHIELLAQACEEIPEPSTDVSVDDDIDVANYFLAHVELPGKTVRLNISKGP
jgi:predicted RNase H-like HicB family nuclease